MSLIARGSRVGGRGGRLSSPVPRPSPLLLLRRLAALPAAHDQPLRGLLLVARLHALLLAPRADHVPAAARAAAVRVVDGVHHLAAHLRPPPEPPGLPGLPV